eukprot:PhM_4_TR5756/c0_g1_i1/m.9104
MNRAAIFVGVGANVSQSPTAPGIPQQQRTNAVRNCELIQRVVDTTQMSTCEVLVTTGDVLPSRRHVLDTIAAAQTEDQLGLLFLYISTSALIVSDRQQNKNNNHNKKICLMMWDSDITKPLETYLTLDDLACACTVPTVVILDVVFEDSTEALPTQQLELFPDTMLFLCGTPQRTSALGVDVLARSVQQGRGITGKILCDTENSLCFPSYSRLRQKQLVALGLDAASTCRGQLIASLGLHEDCPDDALLRESLSPATLDRVWCDTDVCSVVVVAAPRDAAVVDDWLSRLVHQHGMVVRCVVSAGRWFVSIPIGTRNALVENVPECVLDIRWTVVLSLRLTVHQYLSLEHMCQKRVALEGTGDCVCELLTGVRDIARTTVAPRDVDGASGAVLTAAHRTLLKRVETIEADVEATRADRKATAKGLLDTLDDLTTKVKEINRTFGTTMSPSRARGAEQQDWAKLVRDVEHSLLEHKTSLGTQVSLLAAHCEEQSVEISQLRSDLGEATRERRVAESEYRVHLQSLSTMSHAKVTDVLEQYQERVNADATHLDALAERTDRTLRGIEATVSQSYTAVGERVMHAEDDVVRLRSWEPDVAICKAKLEELEGLVDKHHRHRLVIDDELQELRQLRLTLDAADPTEQALLEALNETIVAEVRRVMQDTVPLWHAEVASISEAVQSSMQRMDTIAAMHGPGTIRRIAVELSDLQAEIAALKSKASVISTSLDEHAADVNAAALLAEHENFRSDVKTTLSSLASTTEGVATLLVATKQAHSELERRVDDLDAGRNFDAVHDAMQKGTTQAVRLLHDALDAHEDRVEQRVQQMCRVVHERLDSAEDVEVSLRAAIDGALKEVNEAKKRQSNITATLARGLEGAQRVPGLVEDLTTSRESLGNVQATIAGLKQRLEAAEGSVDRARREMDGRWQEQSATYTGFDVRIREVEGQLMRKWRRVGRVVATVDPSAQESESDIL